MTSNLPWFRFYSEAINDRKIQRVCRITKQPKSMVIGVWTILLSLASDSPERGKLLITKDAPLTLDEILMECELDDPAIINAFDDLGLINLDNSTYTISKWDERQFASDDINARVRKYRAKKKEKSEQKLPEPGTKSSENGTDPNEEASQEPVNQNQADDTQRYLKRYGNVTCNDNETPPESDTESDTDTESNEDDNAPVREEKFSTETTDQKWAAIWNLWTANIRFSESPLTIQEMQCADYSGLPLDWWAESIKIATDNGVYKWAYVRAILDKSRNSRASPGQLSAGGKAKSQKSRDDPLDAHPAIVAYCQTTNQPVPIPDIASEIVNVVGNNPKNIEIFQKIIVAGIRLSWRPNGVEWMLDHVKRREIPSRQKRGSSYAKNGQTSAIPALADRGQQVQRVADPETGEIYWYNTRTRQRVETPA